MKRLIANISGDITDAGYSALVATLAGTLDLKGYIEILSDGRAFVIAEGKKEDLEMFASAICIDNGKIRVMKIQADYRGPTGEFHNFREISPKKDVNEEPQARGSVTGSCQIPPVPDKMEKPEKELCRLHQGFSGMGLDLEQPDKSIEAAGEEWQSRCGKRQASAECGIETILK